MNFLENNLKYLTQLSQKGGSDIFMIGVGGASGCGKTYLANDIRDKLSKIGFKDSEIDIISCDNYYIPYPGGVKAPASHNWDEPRALDLALLAKHLEEIRLGKTIIVPKYNFETSQREDVPDRIINGAEKKIIIVEGLFVLYDEVLRQKFDLKIFTLLDPDICLARRLIRDIQMRGHSFEDTIKQYQEHVKPSYVAFIEPTKRFADIIISTSEFSDASKAMEMIKTYIEMKLKK